MQLHAAEYEELVRRLRFWGAVYNTLITTEIKGVKKYSEPPVHKVGLLEQNKKKKQNIVNYLSTNSDNSIIEQNMLTSNGSSIPCQ